MLKLLLLQILAVSNSPTVTATRFESVTQTSGSMPQAAATSRTQSTYAGNRMRVDVLESSGPRSRENPAGSYMIMDGAHIYTVDSSKKEYYELDIAKMQATAASMFKQIPGLQMKFSQFKFDAQDIGEGEAILGHATRHWRVTGSITLSGLMAGDTIAMTIETIGDHFFAKDLEVPESHFAANDSAALVQFGDMIPPADAENMRSAYARMPHTLDLRMENKVTSYIGPMDVAVTTTTRVTKIESVNVSDSFFAVPPGYKKVEMPLPASPRMSM